jgi:hypothetical protein
VGFGLRSRISFSISSRSSSVGIGTEMIVPPLPNTVSLRRPRSKCLNWIRRSSFLRSASPKSNWRATR